jgi:hypothetical protein
MIKEYAVGQLVVNILEERLGKQVVASQYVYN